MLIISLSWSWWTLKYGECLVNKVKEQNSPYYILKLKKKEDQSMDTLFLLRRGNKIPMEGVTETKCGAETEEMTIQRLPHLGIHHIDNHQNQTLFWMPTRACCQEPDIAVSESLWQCLTNTEVEAHSHPLDWAQGPQWRS